MVQTVFRSLVKYIDKRKLGTLIKKIRRCIIKHKSILAVAVAIMLFALTPPFVNLLVNTEAYRTSLLSSYLSITQLVNFA